MTRPTQARAALCVLLVASGLLAGCSALATTACPPASTSVVHHAGAPEAAKRETLYWSVNLTALRYSLDAGTTVQVPLGPHGPQALTMRATHLSAWGQHRIQFADANGTIREDRHLSLGSYRGHVVGAPCSQAHLNPGMSNTSHARTPTSWQNIAVRP